jgi:hypothetical protein
MEDGLDLVRVWMSYGRKEEHHLGRSSTSKHALQIVFKPYCDRVCVAIARRTDLVERRIPLTPQCPRTCLPWRTPP